MSGAKNPEGRLRKAWRVTVRGYNETDIVYAPTRSKVCTDVWYHLSDVTETRFTDISARREPMRDVVLPARDPIADEMTEDERNCLLHSFGADQGDPVKAGYRDYFYTTRDDPPLVALAERGLMKPMAGDKWGEGMTYFVMTAEGKRVALSLVPEYRR